MPESNVFNLFELPLSEKQIPRIVGNVSSYKKWTELLESRAVRPRRARCQAALRPDNVYTFNSTVPFGFNSSEGNRHISKSSAILANSLAANHYAFQKSWNTARTQALVESPGSSISSMASWEPKKRASSSLRPSSKIRKDRR